MWKTDEGLRVLTLEQSTAEISVHEFPSSVALDYAANVLALNGPVPPIDLLNVFRTDIYREKYRFATQHTVILKQANSSLFTPGTILQTLR